jgi:enamine deaminase RidA (YjgF/YER057c/UK114 family)
LRRCISSGSEFEKIAGYSRALLVDRFVFVSGTTGFNYQQGTISADITNQTRQAFINIQTALAEAGASLADIVRVTYYLTDAKDWALCAPIFGEFLGDIRPAATAIVAKLIDERMKIEIEVTALKALAP